MSYGLPYPSRCVNLLLVSCVGTKILPGPRLRDFRANDLSDRWSAWQESIKARMDNGPTLPARDVYDGSLWQTYLAAFQELVKLDDQSELFVVSAGLGLISGATKIPGYGATFAHGQADSVSRETGEAAIADHRDWWKRVSSDALVGKLRNLPDLANSLTSRDCLIMIMGRDYYSAIYEDLRHINTMSQIVLFGLKKIGEHLQPEVPPRLSRRAIAYADFRTLRDTLGCSMIRVHAETALRSIRHYRLTGEWHPGLVGLERAR
jgi:hypothetical protein